MTYTASLLLLASAVTHVGWNLFGKHQHPTTSFFLTANTLGCVALIPATAAFGSAVQVFSAEIWVLVGAAGLCQAVYYATLAGAYRSGDLSIVYPLARSSPAVFVVGMTLALGRGRQVGWLCMLGIALIVVGCVALPLRRHSEIRLANYLNTHSLLALAAALGTAGYSMLDDEALRQLRQAPGLPVGSAEVTVLYAAFEGMAASLWLGLFVALRGRDRAELRETVRRRVPHAALTGVGIYLAYTVVLISMAHAANVSYVVAFRQLSVPLGAVAGVALLGEPGYAMKFAAVTVMFAGLVLVGVG